MKADTQASRYGTAVCIDCQQTYQKCHPFFESVRVGKRCADCSNKRAALSAREKWPKSVNETEKETSL